MHFLTRDELLREFQKRPEMYVGPLPTAHLWPVQEPLRLFFMAQPFSRPSHAEVDISPLRYSVRCYSGPLKRPISACLRRMLLDDSSRRDLMSILDIVEGQLVMAPVARRVGWRRCFASAYGPLLHYAIPTPLQLFPEATVGIAVGARLSWQQYRYGDVVQERPVRAKSNGLSLFTSAQMDPDLLPGLPYTLDDVRQALAAYDGRVRVRWHPTDDLINGQPYPDANLPVCLEER